MLDNLAELGEKGLGPDVAVDDVGVLVDPVEVQPVHQLLQLVRSQHLQPESAIQSYREIFSNLSPPKNNANTSSGEKI